MAERGCRRNAVVSIVVGLVVQTQPVTKHGPQAVVVTHWGEPH